LTHGEEANDRLELLARSLPGGFEIRLLVLEPGCEVAFEEAFWRDTLVEVECGEVELQFRDDRRLCAHAGDVLWLAGLGVERLSNPSGSPAALTGLARTR
jgi:hypothetical protein